MPIEFIQYHVPWSRVVDRHQSQHMLIARVDTNWFLAPDPGADILPLSTLPPEPLIGSHYGARSDPAR